MDATLNARMDSTLKERGDKVLRDNGISVSAAVRALWQELASTRELPDFLQKASKASAERDAKIQALDALAAIGRGSLSNLTDEEIDAIGMARYE